MSLHIIRFVVTVLIAQFGVAVAHAEEDSPGANQASGVHQPRVGVRGHVGCLANPKQVQRLLITKPGVYENYRIDGAWINRNLVKIKSDNVTLRNCEIFNGKHNAIVVYGKNVVIDSCKIHHLLKGTFKDQQDAHGISGRPNRLVIRNCEIYATSGDSVQFDPDRGPWTDVTIENCTFWTAPLKKAAAGFRAGERPGENALDTKQLKTNARSRVTIRDSLFYGWGQGQIQNQAALNIKENVFVTVQGCVLHSNDICFRLRGDTGPRGGATVQIKDCAIYNSLTGLRMEDAIQDLRIEGLAVGHDIKQVYQVVKRLGKGCTNVGERKAQPMPEAIKFGVVPKDSASAIKN